MKAERLVDLGFTPPSRVPHRLFGLPKDQGHGIGQRVPVSLLFCELPPPTRRELVELGLAPRFSRLPVRLEPPSSFELVKGWIHDNLQQVQRALEKIGFSLTP